TDEIPFPTTPGPGFGVGGGSSDAFVAKLNTTGSSLVYSTFLGGSAFDFGRGIAVDPNCSINCSAYVTGVTGSADFPTTSGAFQTIFGGCGSCGFFPGG